MNRAVEEVEEKARQELALVQAALAKQPLVVKVVVGLAVVLLLALGVTSCLATRYHGQADEFARQAAKIGAARVEAERQAKQLEQQLQPLTQAREAAVMIAATKRSHVTPAPKPAAPVPTDAAEVAALLERAGVHEHVSVSAVAIPAASLDLPGARLVATWYQEAQRVPALERAVQTRDEALAADVQALAAAAAERGKLQALADQRSVALNLSKQETAARTGEALVLRKEVTTLRFMGNTKLVVGVGIGAGSYYLLDRFVFKKR